MKFFNVLLHLVIVLSALSKANCKHSSIIRATRFRTKSHERNIVDKSTEIDNIGKIHKEFMHKSKARTRPSLYEMPSIRNVSEMSSSYLKDLLKQYIQSSKTANSKSNSPNTMRRNNTSLSTFLSQNSSNNESTLSLRKITIVMKENPSLTKADYISPVFTKFHKCQVKSGFLAVIDSFNEYTRKLSAYPVYAILNLHTLSLYKNTNPTSSFLSVRLDRIAYITQKYDNTSCFDVKENNIESFLVKDSKFSVCAVNLFEMNQWVRNISDFKECQLNLRLMRTKNLNSKIIADFNKIDVLDGENKWSINQNLDSEALRASFKREELKDLEYKLPNFSNLADKTENIILKREYEKLSEFIKITQIEKARTTRKLWLNFLKAHQIAENVRRKKEAVDSTIRKLYKDHSQKEEAVDKTSLTYKELGYFRMIEKKIKEFTQREIQNYKKEFEKKIEGEKARAQLDARNMLKTLQDQKKNLSYAACIDVTLRGFVDLSYISKVCTRYYGENKKDSCMKKENFCKYCCEHRVGIRYEDRLLDCKHRCLDLVY